MIYYLITWMKLVIVDLTSLSKLVFYNQDYVKPRGFTYFPLGSLKKL